MAGHYYQRTTRVNVPWGSPNPYYDPQVHAVIFAGILYGVLIINFLPSPWLLRRKSNPQPKRTLYLQYGFTITLILLSTAALLQGIFSVLGSLPDSQDTYPGLDLIELGIPVSLPFTIWGANGITIWNCTCFTKARSIRSRVIIFGVLALLALSSVCGGFLFFMQSKLLQPDDYPITPNLTSIVNILLYFTNFFLCASLEVHPNLKSIRKQWCFWFTQVELGVNCGSIIALTSVAQIVLTFSHTSASIYALHLSPHIYVAWSLQALKAQGKRAKVDGLQNVPVDDPVRTRTAPDDPRGSVLIISNSEETSHI